MQPITGTEINFIIKDSISALTTYTKIFGDALTIVEKSDFGIGKSEAVFTLYGTRFHMLDPNPDYGMVAPSQDHANTIWFNIAVEDIEATYAKALANNCTQIQPVTKMEAMGISNAMFKDEYNYVWLLHEIHEVISYDDRIKALKEMGTV